MIDDPRSPGGRPRVNLDRSGSIVLVIVRLLSFGMIFWGSALVSRSLSITSSVYVPFWLPSAVYLAALLLNSYRTWPLIMGSALIANAAFDLPQGTPILSLFGFYAANTFQATLGAWLLRRFGEYREALRNLKEFLKLVVFIALIAPFVGATLGAGTLVATGLSQSFAGSWETWFANAALADLLIVPLALAWFDRSTCAAEFCSRSRLAEFSLLFFGMAFCAWYVLVVQIGIMSPYKSWLLSFLLLGAIRFDLRGVTLMNLSLGILVAFFTTHSMKGLTPENLASGTYIGVLQGFLAVATLVALLPAIVIAERDAQASELLKNQQRTHLAIETTGVGIWEWNLENDDVKWEASMFQIYGIDPTPGGLVRYDTWTSCVLPEDLPDQEAILQETVRRRGQSRRRFRIRRRNDGEVRFIQTNEAVRLDASGKPEYVIGTSVDVTERERSETALKQSEERFRRLVENSHDVISLYDTNGTILYESAGVERVKGFAAAELIGNSAIGLVHPDDRALAIETLERVKSHPGAVTRIEIRSRHKDGTYRWLDFAATNLLHDPAVRAIVGNYRDITDLHVVNSQLQESVSLLYKLSEQVPGVIYQYRHWPDGRSCVPYASDGIRNIFEVTPEEVRETAEPVISRIHPDDVSRFISSGRKSMETLEEWRCEFRVRMPSRGERWLEGQSVPERLPDGSTLWHGFINDVTDRKQLEARFLQSQKMEAIGRLAGGVAHDFNNLLTVINGYSDILLSSLDLDDPSYSQVESILDAGKRGANLTTQLLTFGRKTVVTPRVFDLKEVVTQSEKLLRRLIGEDIVLTIHASPANCLVYADPNQMDQVILNLAVNARDAMPSGGELVVEIRRVTIDPDREMSDGPTPGRYVQLSVTDSGCGMSNEVKERIFEPFFTTKEQGKGTGLGLATVYGIVKQAAGFVSFESELQSGTAFRILLPEASLPISKSGSRSTNANGGTETVLLVEDDNAVRSISTAILRTVGYSVIAAASGQEALEIFRDRKETVDILVTDVVMPGMNGQELADTICKLRPGFPVICVSGYTNDYIIGREGAAPQYPFLQKPFSPDELARKVREILDSKKPNPSAVAN